MDLIHACKNAAGLCIENRRTFAVKIRQIHKSLASRLNLGRKSIHLVKSHAQQFAHPIDGRARRLHRAIDAARQAVQIHNVETGAAADR